MLVFRLNPPHHRPQSPQPPALELDVLREPRPSPQTPALELDLLCPPRLPSPAAGMPSPSSSPDLHPPAYLQPSSSPPPANDAAEPAHAVPPFQLPASATSASVHQLPAERELRTPLEQLQNQTRRLTTELQELLDAQSFALMGASPASAASPPRASSRVSSAPSSSRSTNRRRGGGGISLSTARYRIFTAMSELADVKAREAAAYSSLAHERDELVAVVSTHTDKTIRLRRELGKIDASPDAARVDKLRSETSAVAAEITELRQRLAALETTHASKKTQLDELENVLASRSASYKSALESMSRKTSAFLAEHSQASPDAAAEVWQAEASAFIEQGAAAEREAEALEEGMELWDNAMREVCLFEDSLRERMKSREPVRKGLKEEIRVVTANLENMVAKAEESGWNLLVAAIGAELQAFREAGELLKRTVLADDVKDEGKGKGKGKGREKAGDEISDHGDVRAFSTIGVSRPTVSDYSPLDD